MIDYDKLSSWIGIQLDDIKALYEATGNEKAFGAIRAYECLLSQIKLMIEVCND